jgi:hypothetical protein
MDIKLDLSSNKKLKAIKTEPETKYFGTRIITDIIHNPTF